VKTLVRISSARFTALVRKVKPGTFEGPEITLAVEIRCDGVEIIRRGFSPEFKQLASTSRKHPGPALGYAELFGFTLSTLDRENLQALISATDDLCKHLEQGKAANEWCDMLELRPVPEWKTTQSRVWPSPLVIHGKDKRLVLSSKLFLRAKPGKR